MSTPESGKIILYWHCCGSENPSDLKNNQPLVEREITRMTRKEDNEKL